MNTSKQVILSIVAMAIASVVNTFVIYKLWSWIIVHAIGANPITMEEAFGIVVLASFLTYKRSKEKTEDFAKELIEATIYVLLNGAYYLFLGFIAGLLIQ